MACGTSYVIIGSRAHLHQRRRPWRLGVENTRHWRDSASCCRGASITAAYTARIYAMQTRCQKASMFCRMRTTTSVRVFAHCSNAGWNGVVFVRSGAYVSGVFRFSVQYGEACGQLVLPSVFFPPILLHPLVEVRSLSTLTRSQQQGALTCLPTLHMRRTLVHPPTQMTSSFSRAFCALYTTASRPPCSITCSAPGCSTSTCKGTPAYVSLLRQHV